MDAKFTHLSDAHPESAFDLIAAGTLNIQGRSALNPSRPSGNMIIQCAGV
jgi:hypothetical protein